MVPEHKPVPPFRAPEPVQPEPCPTCEGPGGGFSRSKEGECHRCYLARRGISSTEEFVEIMPPLHGSKSEQNPRHEPTGPPPTPATELWERKIILAALNWPEILDGPENLRSQLMPEWFTRHEYQMIWTGLLQTAGNVGKDDTLHHALGRLERALAAQGLSSPRLGALLLEMTDDACAAPARVNVNFYAACVAANSPQPGEILDALNTRLGALTHFLGRAA